MGGVDEGDGKEDDGEGFAPNPRFEEAATTTTAEEAATPADRCDDEFAGGAFEDSELFLNALPVLCGSPAALLLAVRERSIGRIGGGKRAEERDCKREEKKRKK